jgi:hypothetical protein
MIWCAAQQVTQGVPVSAGQVELTARLQKTVNFPQHGQLGFLSRSSQMVRATNPLDHSIHDNSVQVLVGERKPRAAASARALDIDARLAGPKYGKSDVFTECIHNMAVRAAPSKCD